MPDWVERDWRQPLVLDLPPWDIVARLLLDIGELGDEKLALIEIVKPSFRARRITERVLSVKDEDDVRRTSRLAALKGEVCFHTRLPPEPVFARILDFGYMVDCTENYGYEIDEFMRRSLASGEGCAFYFSHDAEYVMTASCAAGR